MRKPIFDAIRAARGKGFAPDEVAQVDALLDKLGVPADDEAAPPPVDSAPPGTPPAAPTQLKNPAAFFDSLRKSGLFAALKPDQVAGLNAVLAAAGGARWPISFAAYALATAYHETAYTMQPVREAYWLSEAWRKKNLRYFPFYGRGYVQLTWQANYKRADDELGLGGRLTSNLDLAMDPDIAARILAKGMEEGWFSKDRKGPHNLARHVAKTGPSTAAQYKSARWIINGTDKAQQIADEAVKFQTALQAGGW